MEATLIEWLRRELPSSARLRIGIGDDAAAIMWPSPADCVVTTDLLTDGVDFVLSDCNPQRIGRKALGVNLSDLAAMAARPVAVFVSLALPRIGALELAQALYRGMVPLAQEFEVVIAGGDTNTWDGPLAISITAIGESTSRGLLRRGGAQAGDAILVTGRFGGSILDKQFDFTPRVREALWLNEHYSIHAATDVSDGLSIDLAHIASASGRGAALELATIPIADAAHELANRIQDGRTALDHALADGEDFELILAVPADEAARLIAEQPLAVPLTRIGSFVDEVGLWSHTAAGLQALVPRGFEHNAATPGTSMP